MKKYSKLLALTLCAAVMVSTTGCGVVSKLKNAITNQESSSEEEASDCSSYVTLADYSSIALSTSDIDDETQTQITTNIKNTGAYNKVKKGKVKSGDTVNIYYVGKVNGKKFDGGSCTKKSNPEGYDLEIGSNTFIDGFEDQLVGKKIGGTYKIKVTFPDTYTANTDLAGKKAVFTVTINFNEVYPELSDKFVKKNLSGFDDAYEDTAADYTKYIRASVVEDKAWESVYGDSKVNDYPSDKLKAMKTQLKTSISYYLEQNGYSLSDYLEAQGTTSDDFNTQLDDTAKEDVGKQLIYGAIAEKESIETTDDEYNAELKTYLSNYNCDDEDALNDLFKEYYGTSAKTIIEDDILYKNVKTFLAGNVKES